MKSKKKTDFTQGPILSSILIFCLPIFLGLVFQQFYNMVDSIVVGKYVSANALAAVGTCSPLTMALVGLMSGFTMGASVVASQLIGAGRYDKVKNTISTTAIFIIILAVVITIAAIALGGPLLHLIQVPDDIFEDTLLYFRIFSVGVVLMALYNFFAAFLRALGDSTTPLIFLIISSMLNIFGDLFFVLVVGMGVEGVAIATVIAQGISVILCFFYCRKHNENFHFAKGEFVFDRTLIKDIVRLGVPSCLQGTLSAVGMLVTQSVINSFGSTCIAAYTVASKMERICNLPMMGVAQGLSLYVGQNIGASKTDRATKGFWHSTAFCCGVSILMSFIVFFCGPWLMSLFVNAEDIEVIDIGTAFMKIWAPFIVLHAVMEVAIAFLRGSGDSIYSMFAMFGDLVLRAILAYIFAIVMGNGFLSIARAIPIGWTFASLYCMIRFFTGGWKKKAISLK